MTCRFVSYRSRIFGFAAACWRLFTAFRSACCMKVLARVPSLPIASAVADLAALQLYYTLTISVLGTWCALAAVGSSQNVFVNLGLCQLCDCAWCPRTQVACRRFQIPVLANGESMPELLLLLNSWRAALLASYAFRLSRVSCPLREFAGVACRPFPVVRSVGARHHQWC